METTTIVKCNYCNKEFSMILSHFKQSTNRNHNVYCSKKCMFESKTKKQLIQCKQCGKDFIKTFAEIKKTSNHFCCHSCAAIYNNTHKSHGTRRSKLELYLEQQLPLLYPALEFHFNRKDTINSELDIYIPELKLAFELNGIYHYEPIHGSEKLEQIQNNDTRKFGACQEQGISLCIIDSSTFVHFKEQNAKKYLGIIVNIVNESLEKIKSNLT